MKAKLFLILVLLTTFSFGAARLPKAGVVRTESLTAPEEPMFLMTMGTGIGVADKQMGWALNWGALMSLDLVEPIYVGVDMGAYYWGTDFSRADKSLTAIQVNGTVVYQFPLLASWFHPYFGASLGPVFVTRNEKGLEMGFSGWLRPGLLVPIMDKASIGLEPKLGVLESSFVMVAQLSGVFTW